MESPTNGSTDQAPTLDTVEEAIVELVTPIHGHVAEISVVEKAKGVYLAAVRYEGAEVIHQGIFTRERLSL